MVVYCNDGGSNTSPYETLIKAATTFLVAVDQLVAGEDLLIGHDHHEEPSGTVTYAFPGTAAAPNRVISINTSGEAYLKATAIQVDLATGGTFDAIITGFVKFYGFSLEVGDDISTLSTLSHILWDDCLIELSRAAGVLWTIGGSGGQSGMKFKDTEVNFSGGGAGNHFAIVSATVEFHGGKIAWTGDQPTVLFTDSGRIAFLSFAGVDLSNITNPLIDVSDAVDLLVEFHNCRIAGALTTGTILNAGTRILASGVDDTTGNDLYRFDYIDYYGSIEHDDVIFVTTGAATDPGGTKISWKMVTTGNAVEYSEPLISPPIILWLDSTSSQTLTVECNWDEVSSNNIQNDEIWLEVEYLVNSTDTNSAFINDGLANVRAASGDQTTTSTAWDGDGGFTDQQAFTLDVTITPGRVGPAIGRIHMGGRGSVATTIYVNPKMKTDA